MYTLKNNRLSVSVLDPLSDGSLLGSRYCTGGYIHQITDPQHGPLLTGPQWPNPTPDTFDGQGAPDMFFTSLGGGTAAVGDEVACIGVGQVRRTSLREPFDVRFNREVIQFLNWDVNQTETSIAMQSEHQFQAWHYQIQREIVLRERAVESRTQVHNQGKIALPIRWFPHPFFPIPTDNVLCRFSIPISMEENPGFYLNDDGFVCRKADHDWQRGWYQVLKYDQPSTGIEIEQKHPALGSVTTTIDYAPAFLPIWGNAVTFSFEPYFEQTLVPGETAAWQVTYQF